MSDIDQFDLNLLRVFEALRTEGSVSGAARRLGVSQPGASRALARLRTALGDPLFIAAHGGVSLTPYAEHLAEHVRRALELLIAGLVRAEFDPRRSERRFAVAMSDYAEAVMLPALCDRLAAEAPDVRIAIVDAASAPVHALGDGVLDLQVAISAPEAPGLVVRGLLRDELVATARIDHPAFAPRAAAYAGRGVDAHLVVAPTALTHRAAAPSGAVMCRGGARRVQAQSFLASALLVAQSDWIAMIPRRLALQLERHGMLRIVSLPPDRHDREDCASRPGVVPDTGFELRMYWHERSQSDEGHRWLRRVIREVAADRAGLDGEEAAPARCSHARWSCGV